MSLSYNVFGSRWSKNDDALLLQFFKQQGEPAIDDQVGWDSIASNMNLHSKSDRLGANCRNRYIHVIQNQNIKGLFTKEEDSIIISYTSKNIFDFNLISEKILGRSAKQCRERFYNHLDPSIKHTSWTETEDSILNECNKRYGNVWRKISLYLPGRCENDVKNRWYSKARRKEATISAKDLASLNQRELHIKNNITTSPGTTLLSLSSSLSAAAAAAEEEALTTQSAGPQPSAPVSSGSMYNISNIPCQNTLSDHAFNNFSDSINTSDKSIQFASISMDSSSDAYNTYQSIFDGNNDDFMSQLFTTYGQQDIPASVNCLMTTNYTTSNDDENFDDLSFKFNSSLDFSFLSTSSTSSSSKSGTMSM